MKIKNILTITVAFRGKEIGTLIELNNKLGQLKKSTGLSATQAEIYLRGLQDFVNQIKEEK